MSSLQKQIISEMKVTPQIDAAKEVRKSVDFLKEYLLAHPFLKGFVLGISGGQDSTLTGKLAQMAVDELNEIGNEYKFIAVRLPYGKQADEDDCQMALKFIEPTQSLVVNIKEAVDASQKAVEMALGSPISDFNKGNIKARHRMEVQYTIAAHHHLAVLGTDHSAEALTGFFTKYGDGGADLCPIFRLNKRQGRMLLEYLKAPAQLYEKIPTADLEDNKPGLADESALGVTYQQIDDYLEGKEIEKNARDTIENWYTKTKHKRNLPITVFDEWWK